MNTLTTPMALRRQAILRARRVCAALAALACAGQASAIMWGEVDASYATQGRARVPYAVASTEQAKASAVDGVGRLLIAGSSNDGGNGFRAVVLRLTPDGGTDFGFGSNGFATVDAPEPSTQRQITGLAVTPDHRVLVTLQYAPSTSPATRQNRLCRLTEGGQPDLSFGEAGGCALVRYNLDLLDESTHDVVRQDNGRILVLGESPNPDAMVPARVAVVSRYLANGSPDYCFGDAACLFGGSVYLTVPDALAQSAVKVRLAPDERIVVGLSATYATNNGDNVDLAIARLQPTGDLDLKWDGDGWVRQGFDLGPLLIGDYLRDLQVHEGYVFALAQAWSGNGPLVGVLALDAFGDTNGGFGVGGKLTTFFSDVGLGQYPRSLRVLRNSPLVINTETLLIAGEADIAGLGRVAGALRLRYGDPDPQFGFDGKVLVGLNTPDATTTADMVSGVHVFGDRTLITGTVRIPPGGNDNFAVVSLDTGIFKDDFEGD